MKLYFAYGSNMSEDQMKSRCKTAEYVGIGYLPDYKLGFTRYSENRKTAVADILSYRGEAVWGIIYRLSDNDISELDKHEGHPNIYRRKEQQAILFNVPNDLRDLHGAIKADDFSILRQHHYENFNNYRAVTVNIYEVVNKTSDKLFPSVEYLKLMQDAALKHDFPVCYQEMLHNVGARME